MKLLLIFILIALLAFAGYSWYQTAAQQAQNTKPGKHLLQISNPEKFQNPNTEGATCGGFAAISCAEGFSCLLDSNIPDATGKCVKN